MANYGHTYKVTKKTEQKLQSMLMYVQLTLKGYTPAQIAAQTRVTPIYVRRTLHKLESL